MMSVVRRWGPSLLMMLGIFALSAQPASRLPEFGWIDYLVKKSGHVIGYGMLSLANWHGFRWERRRIWVAWLLAVLYAITDEIHQAFVPGRHPSLFDVLVFDGGGAALALFLGGFAQARRSSHEHGETSRQ